MPKLFIVGSNKFLSEISSNISEDDILLLIGNSTLLDSYGSLRCLAIHMVALEPVEDSVLAAGFVTELTRKMSTVEKCHLNNIYYYAVSSLCKVVTYIDNILDSVGVDQIILPANVGKGWFPLYLTGWGESSRNVMTSIDEFIGPVVVDAFSGRVSICYLKGVLFPGFRSGCKTFIRSVILIVASTVFQLMKVRPKKSSRLPEAKYVFSVRSRHQLNVLRSLVASLDLKSHDFLVLEAEMLTSKMLVSDLRESRLPFVAVFRGSYARFACVVSAAFSLGGLLKNFFRRGEVSFSPYGYDFCVPLRGILVDAWVQPHLLAYRWCLKKILCSLSLSSGGTTFVSFEQVSPQAIIENDVCKVLGLKTIGVKTTSIQSITHPIVSPFDMFLVNDQSEEVMYKDCSVLNKSAIHYIGSPKYSALIKMRSSRQEPSGIFVYATQPHESDSNQVIVSTLAQHAVASGKRLIIRPHPRDEGNYNSFLCSNVVLDSNTRLYELIAGADLLVSRTSTVLEEALYIGTPYLSCCLSEKDRSFCAAYLDPKSGLVVKSLESLSQRLNDLSGVGELFLKFRQSFLEDFCCLTRESLEQALREEGICVES